jgi:hypothetical protein
MVLMPTVMDRLTKMIHLIPTTTTVTATQLAQLFLDRIVVYHGFPTGIVSDRDPRFNSHFCGPYSPPLVPA